MWGRKSWGSLQEFPQEALPNRSPLQAASEEEDSKEEHGARNRRETRGTEMKRRENEQGYRAQPQLSAVLGWYWYGDP